MHAAVASLASTRTQDLGQDIDDFDQEFNDAVISLRDRWLAEADSSLDEQVADLAAWCHTRILAIRPLGQGNLALAQAYVMLVGLLFGVAGRGNRQEIGESAGRARRHARQLLGYDRAIREADQGDLRDLSNYIVLRYRASRRAQRDQPAQQTSQTPAIVATDDPIESGIED